jgi:hypothetical protein
MNTIFEEIASGVIDMARPKRIKNEELVGRAGKIVIKQEDRAREARRWQRKRETLKRFAETR